MAINLQSVSRNTTLQPPRIMIYSVHGIGKTTFAAGSPAPMTAWASWRLTTSHWQPSCQMCTMHLLP